MGGRQWKKYNGHDGTLIADGTIIEPTDMVIQLILASIDSRRSQCHFEPILGLENAK